jgi:DNA-binding MarR family transcriptional regulator
MLNYVIVKSFIMKYSDVKPSTISSKMGRLARDERGCLYDAQVREAMGEHVGPEQLTKVEAFTALGFAARLMHLRMERWAEQKGLSEGRLSVLFLLRHVQPGGMPLGELAGRLNVSPRNVTGLIDNLERAGLVTRTPDPADRRSVLARITDRGTALLESIWDVTVQRRLRLVEGFSQDELVQLRHLCLRVVENLQRDPEERNQESSQHD